MVDNLAEKVKVIECLLNRGRYVLFAYNWEREKCPLYGVMDVRYSGVSNVWKFYGEMVGTFRIVSYIMGFRC